MDPSYAVGGARPPGARVPGWLQERCVRDRLGRIRRGTHETAPAVTGRGRVRDAVERQPPILKTLPPHFGHVPCSAGLPFFIVIFCGFWTSTFILSLSQ